LEEQMKKVTMKTEERPGCPWVVGSHKNRYGEAVEEHCLRIPSEKSAYCPKHELMFVNQHLDKERKMEKARNGKAKKLFRDALAESPLRAENPNFPQKNSQAYSR
jgi:hypothetical protein